MIIPKRIIGFLVVLSASLWDSPRRIELTKDANLIRTTFNT